MAYFASYYYEIRTSKFKMYFVVEKGFFYLNYSKSYSTYIFNFSALFYSIQLIPDFPPIIRA